MLIKWLLLSFCLTTLGEFSFSDTAEARAGRGRSFGRSSGFGGRRAAPPPRQEQPNHAQPVNGQAVPPTQSGGMLRGLGMGLAGGFLGSMLFSSLGHGMGRGLGGGGGMGFLDILLIAGLIYFGFRWWKKRQESTLAYAPRGGSSAVGTGSNYPWYKPTQPIAPSNAEAISREEASDLFFKVQAAWTRRDVSSLAGLANAEALAAFKTDVEELLRNGEVNRLENISLRDVQVKESWNEEDSEFSSVRFTANLLDYTVDAASGKVVAGSDTEPVKFAEDWLFQRPAGGQWQLAGIEQV